MGDVGDGGRLRCLHGKADSTTSCVCLLMCTPGKKGGAAPLFFPGASPFFPGVQVKRQDTLNKMYIQCLGMLDVYTWKEEGCTWKEGGCKGGCSRKQDGLHPPSFQVYTSKDSIPSMKCTMHRPIA